MYKSYKTFFQLDPTKDFYDLDDMDDFDDPFIIRKNCIIPDGFYLVIFVWSVFMMTNISGLVVGAVHNNHTCYENKLIISLSTWLISMTSITILFDIGFIILYVMSMFVLIRETNCFIYTMYIFKLYIGLFVIYSLMMIFIGSIELICQYESCFLEIKYSCIMAILIMSVNFFGMCISCKIKIR